MSEIEIIKPNHIIDSKVESKDKRKGNRNRNRKRKGEVIMKDIPVNSNEIPESDNDEKSKDLISSNNNEFDIKVKGLSNEMIETIKVSHDIQLQQIKLIASRNGDDSSIEYLTNKIEMEKEKLKNLSSHLESKKEPHNAEIQDSQKTGKFVKAKQDNKSDPEAQDKETNELELVNQEQRAEPIIPQTITINPDKENQQTLMQSKPRGLKRKHVPSPILINPVQPPPSKLIQSAPLISRFRTKAATPKNHQFQTYLTPHKSSPYKRAKSYYHANYYPYYSNGNGHPATYQRFPYPQQNTPQTARSYYAPPPYHDQERNTSINDLNLTTPKNSINIPISDNVPKTDEVYDNEAERDDNVDYKKKGKKEGYPFIYTNIETASDISHLGHPSTPMVTNSSSGDGNSLAVNNKLSKMNKVVDIFVNDSIRLAPFQSQPLSSQREFFGYHRKFSDKRKEGDDIPSEEEMKEMEEKYKNANVSVSGSGSSQTSSLSSGSSADTSNISVGTSVGGESKDKLPPIQSLPTLPQSNYPYIHLPAINSPDITMASPNPHLRQPSQPPNQLPHISLPGQDSKPEALSGSINFMGHYNYNFKIFNSEKNETNDKGNVGEKPVNDKHPEDKSISKVLEGNKGYHKLDTGGDKAKDKEKFLRICEKIWEEFVSNK